ncbi:hypothetical protein BJX76DRAFT_306797 [Aspergillus varians]
MDDMDPLSDSFSHDCNTPTDTSPPESYADPDHPPYLAPLAVPPEGGATFVIRDPQTGLVIALRNGMLSLRPERQVHGFGLTGRGSHWHCVENDELWLGFRNAVSGTYIGHDNKQSCWRFIADAKAHKPWEWFCARQHPGGGHMLLVRHNDGFRAMKIGGEQNRELIVGERGQGGTAWEFIVVDDED